MTQFRNLVLEGGGIRGIAYTGALEVLDEQGVLTDIERVAGTSAGAIGATLVALGADVKSFRELWLSTDFLSFRDHSFAYVGDVVRLFRHFGWHKGEALEDWLKSLIKRFAGDENLTFAELATRAASSAPEDQGFRDLYIIGTNLSKQRPEVFSAKNTPDMPIWLALKISVCIPLYFRAVKYKKNYYVDGGVAWNYPLDLFDKPEYLGCDESECPTDPTGRRTLNPQTIGIRVCDVDDVHLYRSGFSTTHKIDGFVGFLRILIDYMWDMANNRHLRPGDWDRTISLNADAVGPVDFDASTEMLEMLIKNGRKGAESFLQWFHDPANTPSNRITDD